MIRRGDIDNIVGQVLAKDLLTFMKMPDKNVNNERPEVSMSLGDRKWRRLSIAIVSSPIPTITMLITSDERSMEHFDGRYFNGDSLFYS
jgi:hypothetical protein